MCGIFGGYDRSGASFGDDLAITACRRMQHRGPDDEGYVEADSMLVCNRRLSILDIGGGHQPMFSDDGRIAVVQNGEIYNFLELAEGLHCRTRCDTEVILRLYERDGEDFVQQLNGMFAIAILDRRSRRLLLYRDRTGQKPLYIHDDGRRLLFASEIKSLLAVGVPAEVDRVALDAFLTYNFVPPPVTLFRGIQHLMPGHRLTVDADGVHDEAWWDLPEPTGEARSESEWTEEIVETLREAVRVRLRADVPLGAFLSGGIDSSAVVRLMSQQLSKPVQTFCIGFDDRRFDESPFAATVAELCGADHTCRIMQPNMLDNWPLVTYHNDQPHGDVSFLPTYQVSRLARQHVKVVLTGDGGDELFAGYDVHRRFFAGLAPRLSQDEFERTYIRAISLFTENQKHALYTPDAVSKIVRGESVTFAQRLFAPLRQYDRINQALGLDVKLLLPGNNLVKPDKMAMAVALEPRAPFLDFRMVDLAFRIPGRLKLHEGVTKHIFKRAAEQFLPHEIIYRKKQMFTVPIGEWFKQGLRPWVEDVLLSPTFEQRGLFDPQGVSRMIDLHTTGRMNYTRQIRALIALELWQRIFIDACFDHAPTYAELGLSNPVAPSAGGRRAA
jgi:asparagine synthase (glutamine-hydrolysing)